MLSYLATFIAGIWAGGALLTFWVTGGSLINRTMSSLFWFTWPLWPGR